MTLNGPLRSRDFRTNFLNVIRIDRGYYTHETKLRSGRNKANEVCLLITFQGRLYFFYLLSAKD
jgi:hypothetical protein